MNLSGIACRSAKIFFGITFWRSLETRLNSVAKPTEFVPRPLLACVTFFATSLCRHIGVYKKHRRVVNTNSNFHCWDFMSSTPISMLFWRAKIILNTFSRPVLDEVHFLWLCCNPASPSEKHVTESRACKTLFRKQVFPRFEIPFGSIWPWAMFRINEESVF